MGEMYVIFSDLIRLVGGVYLLTDFLVSFNLLVTAIPTVLSRFMDIKIYSIESVTN